MVGTANATEDTPASQDAKTLVPMSLSLERSRLQRARLVSLRTLLGADQEQNGKDKPGLCDNVGVNELEATAEKCGVLKDILYGLVDKRAGLEQQYMGLEEQTAREVVALRSKEERLSEGIMKGQHAAAVKANECYDVVRNSLLLLQEDIRSTQWNFAVNEMILLLWSLVLLSDGLLNWFQNSQAEFVASDKYLNAVSQNAQSQAAAVEKVTTALRAEKAAVEDLRTTWQNYEDMIHEEHRQLVIENEIARSEQREFQKLLESKGYEKAPHHTFVEEHNSAITSLEVQTKDIGKKIKGTERAITARNKKVATVNKKVAQKTKVLQEWKARIDAKQDQVTKSAATQEFIDGEALAVQEALNQELRRDEQIQGLLTVQEMESEELRSSCEVLETEIQRANTTLTTMRTSITATQTAVKNRIDEVRDKFLSTFVVGDAENLIELLDKEIESWTVKDTVEVDEIIARETLKLKERYNTLTAETRKTYGRTLRKKVPVAATGHKHELDETMENRAAGENEKQNRELDPSSVERLSNKDKFNKSARRGLNLVDESPQTDKEATDLFTVDPAIAAKVTKPTHSNLPQHRKIDNANGVRPRRLKRRTPAQKTGKPEPTFKTASVAQRNPVADPLDSPAGCDEDLEMTRPVQDADTTEMTSSTTSQDAAKKLQLKKADQRCKGSIKRRTFTKATALHRSRHTKASRISFGRTADWSTADSFSFD
ncbi:Arogenate dehydratase/prephenate dehydratase 1 [Phytophthora nicotianae]|uniref:Arogenate dehydratase/prephenate dehydratase 1 n=1 Tax=Phytophthora nicotianae TaxID=4792 RepID=A0A0W8D5Y4_PHYNI|nr:Arogenate dehydratase/prephenate dehydratase 1 [Phytophthora nicotianae]